MRIPSETWSSLLYIGSSAFLVKKLRESIIPDESTDDANNASLFGASFLAANAGDVEQQQQWTETGYIPFLNPTMFLIPPYYAFMQGSYLLNPSGTNYFQDWVWDVGGGGGDIGEATNLGGFGTFGDSGGSPFGSVSTFGQDVADKIGGVIGAAIGVGFKGMAGFALGLGLGPIGLAGSLLGMAMLDKAMPSDSWGSWGYLSDKLSEAFGLRESFGWTTSAPAGYRGGWGADVGIGFGSLMGGWGINGEMGYSGTMNAGGLDGFGFTDSAGAGIGNSDSDGGSVGMGDGATGTSDGAGVGGM